MIIQRRRQRRRDRDVAAGVGFSWRVSRSSLRRLVAGVLVASGLFAAGASLIRVERPMSRAESRESARVVMLAGDDAASRELLDWARFHSPFPDRWDPAHIGGLEARMEEVSATLEERGAYEARLRPRLVESPEMVLPGLVSGQSVARMALPRPDRPPEPAGVHQRVEVTAAGEGALAERWGRHRLAWDAENARMLLGRSARFMVGVTPGGVVEFCLLEEGISEEVDPLLERWLRTRRLEPADGAGEISWGLVRVSFQPRTGEEEQDD